MSLPGWADPLFDVGEMRAADAWAVDERGVPSLDLMERAGAGLARIVAELAGPGPVRVVCGKGNNGGDGLVAARLLREDGHRVDLISAVPLDALAGDALANLERLPGDPPAAWAPHALDGSGVVVDALLGTGFAGVPREPMASVIAAINAQGAPVVSCDVPSGVDAATGEVQGEAVHALVTATFHGPKIGLHVAPGAERAGEVRVVEIGIPRGGPGAGAAGLISERVLALVPPRGRYGTKFESGAVVVAGGSAGMTGAPALAALGAMRAGAGYVQLAVPAPTEVVFELKLTESMTHALPDEDGAHCPAGVERVRALAERAGAIVLGPGLGRSERAAAFAREVARTVERPLLIDADGLNAHEGRLAELRARPGPTVLTPHAGELARLLGSDSAEIGSHRLACARAAADSSGCVVVLKGDDTIVASPGGPVVVSRGASPGLATAGTGDVLSGIAGAYLSKGLPPFDAAAAAVLAHALAGREAARRCGADHVIAGDVVEALPEALNRPRR